MLRLVDYFCEKCSFPKFAEVSLKFGKDVPSSTNFLNKKKALKVQKHFLEAQ